MPIIGQPPTNPVDKDDNRGKNLGVDQSWRNFFNALYLIANATTQSGTTANRPAEDLWTGRMYWDTTLGYAIWFKTAGWVDAQGNPV